MMTRLRRTRILVEGDEGLARSLAGEIERGHRVTALENANEGLAMIRMRESARNSVYNLGEALVTEAKAIVAGTVGIGIVAGRKPELATNLAIVDAAYAARLPETEAWSGRLIAEERTIEERIARENRAISRTRVSFETMDRPEA